MKPLSLSQAKKHSISNSSAPASIVKFLTVKVEFSSTTNKLLAQVSLLIVLPFPSIVIFLVIYAPEVTAIFLLNLIVSPLVAASTAL